MHWMFFLGVFFSLNSPASVLAPLPDGWQSMNPGGGGAMQGVVCDPSVPGRVYICCDMTGLYRSDDNGVTWDYLADRVSYSGAYAFAVDPSDKTQLYLATGDGLYVSGSAGKVWTFAADTDNEVFHSITVDPNDSSRVYAGPGHNNRPIEEGSYAVYVSRDAGQSWAAKPYQSGTGIDREVYSIEVDPDNSAIVYIATFQGLYKSTDYGDSWSLISRPLQSANGECYGLDLTPDGEFLYAAYDADSSSSVFVTKTSSVSWKQVASGLPDLTDYYWRPQVDPRSTSSSHQVLVGPRDGYGEAHLYEGSFSVSSGEVAGSWSSAVDYDAIDRGWYDAKHRFRHFTYTPASWSSRKVWAITEFVLYQGDPSDTDSWVLRSTVQYGTDGAGNATYVGRGFASTYNWAVAGDDEYLITGAADVGVLESWTEGETWRTTFDRQGDAVHICDTDPKIVLAGWSDGFGGGGTAGELKAKKLIERDGTDTWSLIAAGPSGLAGLPENLRLGAIASSPHNPKQVVVGGRKYTGLYEIDDIESLVNNGTGSFSKIFTTGGLSSASVRNIYFDPNDPDQMYVYCHGGLYRCTKESGTWSSVRVFDDGTEGWTDPNAYVWSHEGRTRMVVCGGSFLTNSTDTVLFYSEDEGATWSSLLTLGEVQSLYDQGSWDDQWEKIRGASAFGYQDRVFCSVNAQSHHRKDLGVFCGVLNDDAVAWENWSGFGGGRMTYTSGRAVSMVEPAGIPYLYVTTTGGGVWRRSLGEANDGNILHNPGFESGYLLPSWDADWPKLESVHSNTYEGSYAMYLKRSSVGNMHCRQVVSCKPSAAYRFSSAVKTQLSEGYAMMQADVLNSSGGVVASFTLPDGVYGTTAYAPYAFEFDTPSNAASIRVYLRILESSGTAWFDNVRLDDLGLLSNPGFETGSLGPAWDDQWPEIETAAANVYDGMYAMKLERGSVGNMQCRQTYSCLPDTRYALDAQMKTALTSGTAGLKVEFYNGGTFLSEVTNYQSCGSSGYHPVLLDFITPANATAFKVYLQMPDSSGAVWFDQVRLYEE